MYSRDETNRQGNSVLEMQLDVADKQILELKTRLMTNHYNFNELMNDMFLLGKLSVNDPNLYGEILHTLNNCYFQKETAIRVDEQNSLTLGRIAAINKSMQPK